MCKLLIADNYKLVKERVEKAAIRAGRDPSEITIVAVSKTKPYDKIEEAIAGGAIHFGENRVQELCDKYEYFSNVNAQITWHQIGRLQRNKVKYLIGKNILIHSVDSLELAEEISKQSERKNVVTDILLQVNISKDENKGGVLPESVGSFFDKVSQMKAINVKGLMTVPEKTQDVVVLRKLFLKMNEIFIDIFKEKVDNNNDLYLSMGMSHDFEIAIECGSNLVRVGTAIFGQR